MEIDKRPTRKDLDERSLKQLRNERASLPTDNYVAQVKDRSLRDMYSEVIAVKTDEGVTSL